MRCLVIAGKQASLLSRVQHMSLARGKEACQFPPPPSVSVMTADKAVDGKKDHLIVGKTNEVESTGLDVDTISTTGDQSNSPWWEVDLGDEDFVLNGVLIYPSLGSDMLHDFDVIVFDKDDKEVTRVSIAENQIERSLFRVSFVDGFKDSRETIGRKVRIQGIAGPLEDNFALSLAEVEVIGLSKEFRDSNYHSYDIDIGEMFNVETEVNYLAFVQDSDVVDLAGHSSFRNVEIYNNPKPSEVRYGMI